MCGIIGITGKRQVATDILRSLKHLEYRGYDSSGIATLSNGSIQRARAEGKLSNLEKALNQTPLDGICGIGHTRWATHGFPNETNAHPHATDKVAVVHNGIIENFRELREELLAKGYRFQSQTDTETVPVLTTYYLDQGMSPHEAVAATLKRLRGAYALAFIFTGQPELLIGARMGPPLAIGYGEGEMYLGSDATALSQLTDRISYLEDGDWAEMTPQGVTLYNQDVDIIERPVIRITQDNAAATKGNYRHFMLKEIHEQPGVISDTLKRYCDPMSLNIDLGTFPFALTAVKRIQLIACGTSYYAAQVAKYWIEGVAGVPADVDVASEYRYRSPVLGADTLTIVISQSGETADTLAVLRFAKTKGPVLAIVNVPESTIAREASAVLYTYAGPEIGVASTKAFTTQLVVLACLTLKLAQEHNSIIEAKRKELCGQLLEVPALMTNMLAREPSLQALAANLASARDMLYIGRGTSFALAMEGALKMKEISYIHAEAYAAGELKHGPIALIDDQVPVIVLAPSDVLFEKTISNLQEAAARGGKIILISDEKGVHNAGNVPRASVSMPECDAFISPILYALPVQILAYHVAVLKGTDVDQPRNLAKSVTVE